jgi:P27 family predicted phage terminase small subunit
MGRRGRHPDPNSKRSQAAVARAKALGIKTPAVAAKPANSSAVPMPGHLEARPLAVAFWEHHADALVAGGRLKPEQAETFGLLANLYADCRELAEQLAAEGWVTSTEKGQAANPVARLLRDARRDYVMVAREFGLTPAAEGRLPTETVDAEEIDAEEAELRAFTG